MEEVRVCIVSNRKLHELSRTQPISSRYTFLRLSISTCYGNYMVNNKNTAGTFSFVCRPSWFVTEHRPPHTEQEQHRPALAMRAPPRFTCFNLSFTN